MKKIEKYAVYLILLFSIYHFLRDILQTLNFDNSFTNIFHRDHYWCRPYCDLVTYPLDLFGIIAALIILRRNKSGVLAKILYCSLFLWLGALLIK